MHLDSFSFCMVILMALPTVLFCVNYNANGCELNSPFTAILSKEMFFMAAPECFDDILLGSIK